MDPRPKLKSILKKTSKYDTNEVPPQEESKRDKHPHATKLASMFKPTEEEDDETMVDTAQHTPKVINQSTPGVSSSTQCFTEPPTTPPDSPMEDHPELFNYHDQVVTRSAMELLEMEDEIAARDGLFERDGIVMTASALSLLQAQEAMARADTAGQGEWGPDEWDGIRGQYIPKWAKKLTGADRWPLVDDDGKPLRNEDGTRQEDWFEADMDQIEERNLLRFGMQGVVDHNY